MPKEKRHFASCIGETTIQLHGMGPFVSNYVNPADDPDKKNDDRMPGVPVSSGERSKGNTERRILCNFNVTTLLPIAA